MGVLDLAEALPPPVGQLLERAITVEYTSLTSSGRPVMVPVTPYVGSSGGTLDVSTGFTYPAKAERGRRNPKVCLLFSDDVGSGVANAPVVLVQGIASVRDADLQANTDRYVRLTLAKVPTAFRGTPRFVLRRLPAYFARIWIEVTPTRIWWWDSKTLDREPSNWVAPEGIAAPPSDQAPPGRQPEAWLGAPPDWRVVARHSVAHLDHVDLAWVGPEGWPCSIPVVQVSEGVGGLQLQVGTHLPHVPHGPACLTFHTHSPTFTTQENHTFVGDIFPSDSGYIFQNPRVLGDVSLKGNKIVRTVGFLRKVRQLHSRLEQEATRRGQPVPSVNLP